MKRITWLIVFAMISYGSLLAQPPQSPVLFSFDDESVSLPEFKYVYFKNNPNNPDPTIQDLQEYLNLYINFKLKVAEAENKHVDTLPNVRRDLSNYLEQLYKSSLEKILMDDLLNEAYERMKQDVRVSHILISVAPDAKPEDTLKAYQKIMSVRDQLLNSKDFEKVAQEVSDDQYVQENKGDIGYITALSIPFYNFETAAYETPVGSVSLPVRTRLGYHLVHPTDKRPAMGSIQVAHILVKVPEDATDEDFKKAKAKADSLYRLLQNGADFGEVAKAHSDDKMTADNGGLMEPFGAGRMIPSFEITAYNLKQDGDIAKPFKSKFGYHIIKRVSRTGIGEKADLEEDMKKKIQRDERFNIARERQLADYKKKFAFVEFPDRFDPLTKLADSTLLEGKWSYDGLPKDMNKTLFMLQDREYTADDFLEFVAQNQVRQRGITPKAALEQMYEKFKERSILEYGISKVDEDYPMLKQEYHDGILMFALMDDQVWSKAIKDTAGLEAYYAQHKSDHMWDTRAHAKIYTIHDPAQAEKIMKKAEKWDDDKLRSKFNKDEANPVLTISEVKVEKGTNPMVDTTGWEMGFGTMQQVNDSTLEVVRVLGTVPPEPKALNEARGAFISDYQQYLEKTWVESLRKKYPVTLHDDLLQKLLK